MTNLDLFSSIDTPAAQAAGVVSVRTTAQHHNTAPQRHLDDDQLQLALVNGRPRKNQFAMAFVILNELKKTPNRKMGVKECLSLILASKLRQDFCERSALRLLDAMADENCPFLVADNNSPKGYSLTDFAKTFLGVGTTGEPQ